MEFAQRERNSCHLALSFEMMRHRTWQVQAAAGRLVLVALCMLSRADGFCRTPVRGWRAAAACNARMAPCGGDEFGRIARSELARLAAQLALSVTASQGIPSRSEAAPSYSSDQSCILTERRKFRVLGGRQIEIRQEMVRRGSETETWTER